MPVLTAITIVKLKPKARRYEVRDTRSSLRVIVFPSGAKSFIMRFRRRDGRSAKLTLGRVREDFVGEPVLGGPLSLAAARKLAASIDLQRAQGQEPVARRRRDDASSLYPAVVARYITEHAMPRTRGWRRTARCLGVDGHDIIARSLADRWRTRPVATITRDDMHDVVDEMRLHGVPGQRRRGDATTDGLARRTHAVYSSFFAWCMRERLITTNPCANANLPPKGAARERVLTDAELVAFWRACDELDPPMRGVFRLLLLTGQRLNEVARMKWDEVVGDVWTLPASRTKNKREHAVPLTRGMLDIIESMPRVCEYVFTNDGRRPAANFPKDRVAAIMRSADHWTLHDLRRTAATGMARAGADLHVIERALNHVSGSFGGIVGVYQRYRYADEMRRALEAWEVLLLGIVSGKVVAVRAS
jgi:integrase